jgi:hypothetical protein
MQRVVTYKVPTSEIDEADATSGYNHPQLLAYTQNGYKIVSLNSYMGTGDAIYITVLLVKKKKKKSQEAKKKVANKDEE